MRSEIARPTGDGADIAIRNHRTCGDRFWTRLMTGAMTRLEMICKLVLLVWSVLAVPVKPMGLSEPAEAEGAQKSELARRHSRLYGLF